MAQLHSMAPLVNHLNTKYGVDFYVFLFAALFVFFLMFFSFDIAAEDKPVLFISPDEIKAGTLVAEENCVKCHGVSGESDQKNIPHLSGQHADYLFSQLIKFQSGERVAEKKQHAFRSLNESALQNVAIYYSVQDLSVRGQSKKSQSKKKVSPLQAGKLVAEICANCHGKTGNGTFSGMPRLTGKHQVYLVSAITAYKTGARKDAMMSMAAASLSTLDIENLALFYANQKPEGSEFKISGDASSGRELSSTCGGCHGEIGNSETPEIPSLAGQDPAYLIKAINAYKGGLRSHDVMRSAVEALTKKKISDIAAFYGSQSPKIPSIVQPQSVTQIAEKCDRCHGINGNSQDRFIPSISGQRESYLVLTLTAFKQGLRRNSMMTAMLEPLRDVDIDALAKHYTNKHRRAVVFADKICD